MKALKASLDRLRSEKRDRRGLDANLEFHHFVALCTGNLKVVRFIPG